MSIEELLKVMSIICGEAQEELDNAVNRWEDRMSKTLREFTGNVDFRNEPVPEERSK